MTTNAPIYFFKLLESTEPICLLKYISFVRKMNVQHIGKTQIRRTIASCSLKNAKKNTSFRLLALHANSIKNFKSIFYNIIVHIDRKIFCAMATHNPIMFKPFRIDGNNSR